MYSLIGFLSGWDREKGTGIETYVSCVFSEGDHDPLNNLIWLITLRFSISNLAPHQIRNYFMVSTQFLFS